MAFTQEQRAIIDETYQQGALTEELVLPHIMRYFKTIGINLDTYALRTTRHRCLDFEFTTGRGMNRRTIEIEVKGRTNSKRSYETTIFGNNKFERLKRNIESRPNYRGFVFFVFTDCVSFIEITSDTYFMTREFHSYKRWKNETTFNVEVPVEQLTDIPL